VPERVPTETVRQQVAAELAHYLGHRNLQRDIRRLRLIDLRDFGRTSVCESPWRLRTEDSSRGPLLPQRFFSPNPRWDC
jgi:hypothetical protein